MEALGRILCACEGCSLCKIFLNQQKLKYFQKEGATRSYATRNSSLLLWQTALSFKAGEACVLAG